MTAIVWGPKTPGRGEEQELSNKSNDLTNQTMAENSELEDEEGVMGRAIKSIDDLSFAKLKKQADRRRRKKFLEEQQLTGFARKSALWFDGLVSSDTFNQFIIAMILLTGSLAGVATYSSMQEGTASTVLTHVDDVILYIFTAEIAVKMLALGKQPQAYFWVGVTPSSAPLHAILIIVLHQPFFLQNRAAPAPLVSKPRVYRRMAN